MFRYKFHFQVKATNAGIFVRNQKMFSSKSPNYLNKILKLQQTGTLQPHHFAIAYFRLELNPIFATRTLSMQCVAYYYI